jgi:hypothetical protein
MNNQGPGKPTLRSAAATAIFLMVCGFFVVGFYMSSWRAPTYALWHRVKIGDNEAVVRSVLGEPRYAYEKATAPEDYYIEGYGKKVRPITGKVLIYSGTDLIMYVYLDSAGRVEEKVIANS